jgi:hypothetical protein
MHDLIGCNKESCDRNNKKENQILDECKTIKTEDLFRCDQGDPFDDMRLQKGDGIHECVSVGFDSVQTLYHIYHMYKVYHLYVF